MRKIDFPMRIGLLNCITHQEETDLGVTEMELFSKFLRPAAPGWVLCEYRVAEGELPETPTACDGWLISGSPQGVYDSHQWIANLSAFIRRAFQAKKPLVGICFGHQILAQALGGEARKADLGWGIGRFRFKVTGNPDWMKPHLSTTALYFCHQDQVVTIPEGAVRLGGDKRCPHAIFAIGNQVLGIQGHPEFFRPLMTDLIEKKRATIGDRLANRATASLAEGEPDNRVVARWIVNFFSRGDDKN